MGKQDAALGCRGEQKSSKIVLQGRPLKSITCRRVGPTLWCWPGCSSPGRRVNIGSSTQSRMHRHLQKHLQSDGILLVELWFPVVLEDCAECKLTGPEFH